MADVKLEIKTNNIIYECFLEERYYNIKDRKPVVIGFLSGIIPVSPTQVTAGLDSKTICEQCFKEHEGKGLNFEEPSTIYTPSSQQIISANKGGQNGKK